MQIMIMILFKWPISRDTYLSKTILVKILPNSELYKINSKISLISLMALIIKTSSQVRFLKLSKDNL